MKRLIISLVLFSFFTNSFCQKPDDIVGYWLTTDDETHEPNSQIQIFKAGNNKYYGKIVWLSEPLKDNQPKKDEKNPDKKLRTKPVLGLQILNNFKFEDNMWSNGTIYDPKSGNTYKCKMWFENNNKNTLYLRGYIGVSLIGRNTQWKKEDKKR